MSCRRHQHSLIKGLQERFQNNLEELVIFTKSDEKKVYKVVQFFSIKKFKNFIACKLLLIAKKMIWIVATFRKKAVKKLLNKISKVKILLTF